MFMSCDTSKMVAYKLLVCALFLQCFTYCSHGKKVAMKVVEEPSTYGFGGNAYQGDTAAETNTLKMRIPPSNFSGPPHLQRLVGKCFSTELDTYEYKFCPFFNVSQHEKSLRWNPYNGILGVWEEWEIENNTFVAMLMGEGDACGSKHRTTRVIFECSNKTEIGNVSEPETCHYQLKFLTPLVCHRHSMLVYPTLSEELRKEWDVIETRLKHEEITMKGYKKLLRKLFERAGYQLESKKKEALMKEAEEKDKEEEKISKGEFETLSQCSDEYKKLKDEVARLKQLLETNNIADENGEQRHGHGDDFYGDYMDQERMRFKDYNDMLD